MHVEMRLSVRTREYSGGLTRAPGSRP